MRDLTKKQRNMLDKWYNEQVKNGKKFGLYWCLGKDNDFSKELYDEIDSINPCEIFYSNVELYIQDKADSE